MVNASKLPVDTSANAMELARAMFGSGIEIRSATYNGDPVSSGIYNQGLTIAKGIAPSDSGVILSTDFTNSIGKANQTINRSTDTGGADNGCGMNAVTGVKTFDAAIFRANFVAAGSTLTMQIAFSSEEYLEYVG